MGKMLSSLFRHPSGRIGLVIIGFYLLAAILGTLGLTPHDPLKLFAIDRLKAPSGIYWFGTDLLGRDAFSRLMVGIRQSMLIAFASVAIAKGIPLATIGKLLGHALPETTARYAHLADDIISESADRICSSLASALGIAA